MQTILTALTCALLASSRVAAGTYAADPGHTMVVWEVDHFGFSKYSGIFGDVAGTLVIDPANPAAARVDVTIPVAKVTTASAAHSASPPSFVCRHCGHAMIVLQTFTRGQTIRAPPP